MSAKLFGRLDPILAIALALALLFCLYGINWGRVECWNRDEMALRNLHGLRPAAYFKPPFHTYVNYFLVVKPLLRTQQLTKWLSGQKPNFNEAKLLGSRLVVVGLFLGTIWLAFLISRQAYGLTAARVIALLFATSAGFIAYAHFLSCDSPLLFWMMLTLFFAQRITLRPEISNYVLAGLLTGICTATKYNGLAIGITIVVAHFLSRNETSLKNFIFSRRLALGLFMVPVGFVIGNPYAILDWKKFSTEFLYNYYVTPRYEGHTSGHGYLGFLLRIPEIIGLPGTILIAVAIALSILFLARRREIRSPAAVCFTLSASLVFLYYVKIGSFPRTPTRFVLPVVPFCILMAGPFLQFAGTKRYLPYAIVAPVLLYNSICSFYVGQRFAGDPRTAAQAWIQKNAVAGSVLESSAGSPHWEKLPRIRMVELNLTNPNWAKASGFDVIDLRMPHANGRAQLFAKIFADAPSIAQSAKRFEGDPDPNLFTREQLARRNPSIVTIYSSDYEVRVPEARNYYMDFLEQRFPYEIVFDGKTNDPPRWVYPRDIDFLRGRITILTRRPDA